jgi:nicotinamide mononucleotide adenylyltransferase
LDHGRAIAIFNKNQYYPRNMTYGVVHGRFQPVHNDHLRRLILPASKKCDFLIVGIANPSVGLTAYDATNPHRSEVINNPFSYWERLIMVRASLLENNITCDRFTIVPFPINFPEQISNYVPREAIHFLTVYDEWGRKKQKMLEEAGLIVEVLQSASLSEKGISGTDVRTALRQGQDWERYVPSSVARFIHEQDIDVRLSGFSAEGK